MGRSRKSVDRAIAPGAHASFRVCGWSTLAFPAKVRLVHSNQKNGVLISSTGVLFKELTKERLWEAEETIITRVLVRSDQERKIFL